MTSVKLKKQDNLSTVDYLIMITLKDGTLRFVGQGLKWRQNPLHPIGWKKLSTAKQYAKLADGAWLKGWETQVETIAVCERSAGFSCLSSIAISKQSEGLRDVSNS